MTGIDRERCIGFGGQLDSARFRSALKSRDVTGPAFVMGEHGEHQVPVFSQLKKTVRSRPAGGILRTPWCKHGSDQGERRDGIWSGIPPRQPGPEACLKTHGILSLFCSSRWRVWDYRCSLGVPVRIGQRRYLRYREWKLDAWEEAGDERSRDICTGTLQAR